MIKNTLKAFAVAAAIGLLPMPTLAYQAGDWIVRVGAITVDPQEDSSAVRLNGGALPGSGVGLNSDTQLGLTLTYMTTDRIGVEVVAATPFKHRVSGTGAVLNGLGLGPIADIKHLPPTLLVHYYFNDPASRFQPHVGLGVNYTTFFSEKATPAYEAVFGPSRVSLQDSVGLAAKLGMDYQIAQNLRLTAAVFYADIDTEATITSPLAGARVRTSVAVDPFVYMLGLALQF